MVKQGNIDRYPNLVESVIQKTAGHESSFLEDEDYAMVNMSYSISSFIPSYVDWILTKEASEDDINLIEVDQFSSYQIIPPPPEEEEPVELDDEAEISEVDDRTEIVFPQEIIFEERDFLPPISLSDRQPFTTITPRPISGEGEQGQPRLGSSTPRGGVLGGINYSNPQDAIDNEFRFRNRITDRER